MQFLIRGVLAKFFVFFALFYITTEFIPVVIELFLPKDIPNIKDLFKDFRITQLTLTYTVGRDKTGKTSGELVICNW